MTSLVDTTSLTQEQRDERAFAYLEDSISCIQDEQDDCWRGYVVTYLREAIKLLQLGIDYDLLTYVEMSVRTYNGLCELGITTLTELITYTEQELMQGRFLGLKSVHEIKAILLERGMFLRGEDAPPPINEESLIKELYLHENINGRLMHYLGLKTVGELIKLSEHDLRALPYVGETRVRRVKSALRKHGMSLARHDVDRHDALRNYISNAPKAGRTFTWPAA